MRSDPTDSQLYQAQLDGGEPEDYVPIGDKKASRDFGSWQRGEQRTTNVVAEYDYLDENRNPYLRVERTADKQFPQSHWENGRWVYGKPKGPKIPYFLPDLIDAAPEEPVFICEGEKDTENVATLGLISTCASEGALKWTPDLNKWFEGKDTAYILEDNDYAGRKHARQVAENLRHIVKDVRIVSLPGLPENGDVSDWIAAGGKKEELLSLAAEAPPYMGLVLDPSDPMRSARAIIETNYTDPRGRLLHRYRDTFWHWDGTCYRLFEDEPVRSAIWNTLDGAYVIKIVDEKRKLMPFKPTKSTVANVFEALIAQTQMDASIDAPTWLHGGGPSPDELVACKNGLLHLPTRKLHDPTPRFFNLSATDVVYDPDAPVPKRWLEFMDEVLANPSAIAALQEWFGYALSPDTSQQKILLGVGPKRSGKGTVARVLTGVLGRASVTGPTMGSLAGDFGLEPLITSPMAIVSDARIGKQTNKSVVVERLLSVSGEDRLTVPRKHKLSWTGRLRTRIMILTNDLPALTDGSGALAGRFLPLIFVRSFFGEEDTGLEGKLLTELTSILNWSLDGYDRLRERGRFVMPDNSAQTIEAIETISSPAKAFVLDCCVVGPGQEVKINQAYRAYRSWCKDQGIRDPMTKEWFGKNLREAVPGLDTSKKTVGVYEGGEPVRVTVYVGFSLNKDGESFAKQGGEDGAM